jgi:hypothetical protein
MINILEEEIKKTLVRFPSVKVLGRLLDNRPSTNVKKAIIFLGQFGGSSAYLKKRMADSVIAKGVKIRHSQSGKLDVVKGAIAERLTLDECFVRQYQTSKSYGTLVTLVYDNKVKGLFPNPHQHGAVPFEDSDDGRRLKVIEWAIPKVSIWGRNRFNILAVVFSYV